MVDQKPQTIKRIKNEQNKKPVIVIVISILMYHLYFSSAASKASVTQSVVTGTRLNNLLVVFDHQEKVT